METSTITARNRETALRFLAGTHGLSNEGVNVIDSTVHEHIRCHGFPGGDPVDRASYKQFFLGFQQAFSNLRFELLSLLADEQNVAARWRLQARHTGEFAGALPRQQEIAFEGMVQYRMEQGLIAETWLHMDSLGFFQQIGALAGFASNDSLEAGCG